MDFNKNFTQMLGWSIKQFDFQGPGLKVKVTGYL